MGDLYQRACWQMNEATSLLREARQYLPEATGLAEEIDEALPEIQSALEAFAAHISDSTGGTPMTEKGTNDEV